MRRRADARPERRGADSLDEAKAAFRAAGERPAIGASGLDMLSLSISAYEPVLTFGSSVCRLPSTNAAPEARSCYTRDVLHSAHHSVYMMLTENLE